MRYKRITAAATAIALLLAGIALLTATVRSRGHGEVRRAAAEEAAAGALSPERWRALGREVFAAECSACHGAAPGGVLAPEVAAQAREQAGAAARAALTDLLLHGTVDGEPDAHPAYPELGDAELAAVLGALLGDGGEAPLVGPDDVGARR